ncbi:metal ABC transporter substrate-binding protein [Phycisphaera mikurensis]|uniref:ABC transporter substrate binding protein n=1 Tax=Phycisphaera mikurensis (strain NBRC 102666 / KCTC 22515 / FYK2301M01) TaxID=1142394 RepID=I0IEN0_PHYMF|nr:metal ABC transporter substrate-binding protein [Phycisphaera mikurensis]MBB6441516.1 ABC-type Zn uptake system ZnuABC Zn-binding protein ZnuA [Phycisphaera mikurensis]BAM03718.1 ABC transporter substrate binding protein [Phycisphaera mikurensis NBRC 102666]
MPETQTSRSISSSRLRATLLALLVGLVTAETRARAEPLRVCATATDARALVEVVGGDAVEVTGFVAGPDDPHVVEPTRSMIEALARADLLVVVGLGLEQAWLPGMLATAGRADFVGEGQRRLDLSSNLRTVAGPEGRGVPGSFHPEDNPHFLADPVEGVKAAAAIADRLSALRPEEEDGFRARYRGFAGEVMAAMLGAEMAAAHGPEDFEALCIAIERGELAAHLREHGSAEGSAGGPPPRFGGWLAAYEPFQNRTAIGDHDLWPYFARRYGIRVLGYMEPEPGLPPTAPHLAGLVAEMKEAGCRVILSVQYFDPRHARFVSEATGAVQAELANQPGGREGTGSYLEFVNHNAGELLAALRRAYGPEARP